MQTNEQVRKALDTDYFGRKLAIITRDLCHYTAHEMARELVRLAKVADDTEAIKEALATSAAPERAKVETVTLAAFQLQEALDFAAPDRDADPDQWETELTFGIVRHQDDAGVDCGLALCCWNDDTDGVLPLNVEYVPDAAPERSGESADAARFQQVWDDAIEEAALSVEAQDECSEVGDTLVMAAENIRMLKGQPDTDRAPGADELLCVKGGMDRIAAHSSAPSNESAAFEAYWAEKQECPEHSLTTKNCANATWHARAALAAPSPTGESLSAALICWSCKKPYTAEQRLDADGMCPHCNVEIELDDVAPTGARK